MMRTIDERMGGFLSLRVVNTEVDLEDTYNGHNALS
jgi:hypothetical protein